MTKTSHRNLNPLGRKNNLKMKIISLIIPIYNEDQHLLRFITQLDTLKLLLEKELIFIDDNSSDNSYSILNNFNFISKVIIFHQPTNQGKGSAIKKGIELATGDLIGVQDADFEYDMRDIPNIIQPILDDKADVVYGSRFMKGNLQVHRTFHILINYFLTLMSNLFSGIYLSDMETCYKFFKSSIIKNIELRSNRFGFEPEITAKIARLKIRVMEVPISYYPRNYLEGKKISWKDGVAAIKHILFFNLIYSKEDFFKKEIPEDLLPKDRNWL